VASGPHCAGATLRGIMHSPMLDLRRDRRRQAFRPGTPKPYTLPHDVRDRLMTALGAKRGGCGS
jgi:hypothetical protein